MSEKKTGMAYLPIVRFRNVTPTRRRKGSFQSFSWRRPKLGLLRGGKGIQETSPLFWRGFFTDTFGFSADAGGEKNRDPTGAVVGLNSSGKATYGGICPAKGKPASIEFVLWALSKTIPLSNGFLPAVAEHDYSHSELASATTYATAEPR